MSTSSQTTSTSSRSGCGYLVAAFLLCAGLGVGYWIVARTGNWYAGVFIGGIFVVCAVLSLREKAKPPRHMDEDVLWPDDGVTFYRRGFHPLRHPSRKFRGGGASGRW
jgi:hypothetical protein